MGEDEFRLAIRGETCAHLPVLRGLYYFQPYRGE